VHAWIFRHRHGLRAVYGLPPEERLAPLLSPAARTSDSGERPPRTRATQAPTPTSAASGADVDGRVRQLTLRPWRRPA